MDNAQEHNREQLKQCFIDLAQRAKELNEPYIYSVSLVLAGSISECSDAALAMWVAEFARMRIDMIQNQPDEDEQS